MKYQNAAQWKTDLMPSIPYFSLVLLLPVVNTYIPMSRLSLSAAKCTYHPPQLPELMEHKFTCLHLNVQNGGYHLMCQLQLSDQTIPRGDSNRKDTRFGVPISEFKIQSLAASGQGI